MKNYFLPIAMLSMLLLFSCSEDQEEPAIDENTLLEVMAVDNAIAEVQNLVNAADIPGGRMKDNHCATVDFNQEMNIMTLDFGTGCTGPAGINRSGKIMVEYNGSTEEWFKHTISFENYQVEGLKISGSISSNFVAETTSGSLKLSRTVSNFSIQYADNSTLTLSNAQHTYEYVYGEILDFTDDHVLVTGESSGITRKEIPFSSKIADQVKYSIPCMSDQIFYPVMGKIDLTIDGGNTYQLDFGGGECDKDVTVSIDNFSKTITLD